MQFVILGSDAKDADALNRRMSVRKDHQNWPKKIRRMEYYYLQQDY